MSKNNQGTIMKNLTLTIALFIISQGVIAENDDHYLGNFKGSEDFAVTCSNSAWNNSGNRSWSVNHYEVNGNKYKGTIRTDGGQYQAEGTISGNSATGTFTGKDKNGNTCNGEFSNTLESDQLKASAKGSCPSVGCTFTGEVTATRQ